VLSLSRLRRRVARHARHSVTIRVVLVTELPLSSRVDQPANAVTGSHGVDVVKLLVSESFRWIVTEDTKAHD
jgi:hypothetical protein